ncbi:MAG: hypothetical protein KDC92_01335 [Bacteroidetes bacterium]|nr:hypothetical protein [Bacteroidota bacterium]
MIINKKIWVAVLALAFLVTGCIRDKQFRYKRQMEGTWSISEVREHILYDGTTVPISSGDDIATLTLAKPEFEEGIFLDYSFALNTGAFAISGNFKTDESRQRAFLYYFYCESLFGCDLIATIEEDKVNKQVWSFIRRDDYNGEPTHAHTTWTLTKVE